MCCSAFTQPEKMPGYLPLSKPQPTLARVLAEVALDIGRASPTEANLASVGRLIAAIPPQDAIHRERLIWQLALAA